MYFFFSFTICSLLIHDGDENPPLKFITLNSVSCNVDCNKLEHQTFKLGHTSKYIQTVSLILYFQLLLFSFHLQIVGGVLLEKILDPLVVNLEVGDLSSVRGSLLLARLHTVEHGGADTWDQSPKKNHMLIYFTYKYLFI